MNQEKQNALFVGPDRPELRRKVLKALNDMMPESGTAGTLRMLHDDWCNLLSSGGDCNRNPEIIREKIK
jgi:hypothetical protein